MQIKNCFVMMSFDDEFKNIYELGIKNACLEININCERVDEQTFTHTILEQIYDQIKDADILIADLTKPNLNVYYELGYAHGNNKKVILLTSTNVDNIPFDLKNYYHIVYDNNDLLNLKYKLIEKLTHFKNSDNIEFYKNKSWLELITQATKKNDLAKITEGAIVEHEYKNEMKLYRLIPEPYNQEQDNFYKNFDGIKLSNIVAKRCI